MELKSLSFHHKPDISLNLTTACFLSSLIMVNFEAYLKLKFSNLCNLKVNYSVCDQSSSIFVSSYWPSHLPLTTPPESRQKRDEVSKHKADHLLVSFQETCSSVTKKFQTALKLWDSLRQHPPFARAFDKVQPESWQILIHTYIHSLNKYLSSNHRPEYSRR